MDKICELYSELQNRHSLKNNFTPVTELCLSKKFLLGISENRTPMFLIDCKFENVVADLKLKFISILFNKNCKLIGDDNEESLKVCSIIMLNSESYDFQNYFLEVIYLLLQNIPKNPSLKQISKEIDKIIALFSHASKPTEKTVQGLWAEMFLISQSQNPEYMIKAWHCSPESKFDFNDGTDKIEVKSTGKKERIHTFSLEQLNQNEHSGLIVASIFTTQTGIGKNISDLRSMIFSRISDIQIQTVFDSIVFKALGSDLENAFDFCYDYQAAADTLRFFDSRAIPKIKDTDVPPEVSDVKFSCCLANVSSIPREALESSKSNLFRSL
ncbi:MAG: PD-(D/E)XK motif protein [Treponemataceae bacterium]|nr:PD-(D/E)XK motif protein [Treponemataceae bacterium]